MNARDLDAMVRDSMERQALFAPEPDSLLETVKTRSRRRRVRAHAAAACVMAAAGIAAVVGTLTLFPDRDGGATPAAEAPPTSEIHDGTATASEQFPSESFTPPRYHDPVSWTGGISVPASIDACLVHDGDTLVETHVTERINDPSPTPQSAVWAKESAEVLYPDVYMLWTRGSGDDWSLEDAEDISVPTVDGTATLTGHVGVSPGTGLDTLVLESGVRNNVLLLQEVPDNPVDGKALAKWAGKFSIHRDAPPCREYA
ncbi:MAG: hypothetical protein ACRDXX_15340 [Stackebrandtia sp.]